MKKWAFLAIILTLFSCKGENSDTYFTPGIASAYFKDIEQICNRDSGKLWGQNLYGPLMFVERGTRRIITNQPDNEGILKSDEGVFTGIYPKELILSNAPVKFGGRQFAMTTFPPPPATATPPAEDDKYRIETRAIHSLFHRFQENEGITASIFNVNNMDEREARFWIKLEWKALRKAIESDGEETAAGNQGRTYFQRVKPRTIP